MPNLNTFCSYIGAATLVTVVVGAVGTVMRPTVANAAIVAIESLVTCASTTACVAGKNSAAGSGISGSSATGVGVTANGVGGLSATGTTGSAIVAATTNGYGVLASSHTGIGVKGYSPAYYGVEGVSDSNYGVQGVTTTGSAAVYGTTKNSNGNGVEGVSFPGTGVFGKTDAGVGVGALAGSGVAISAFSIGNDALDAITESDAAINALASGPESAGIYSAGSIYGVASAAGFLDPTTAFPYIAFGLSQQPVFYVDANGDIAHSGTLSSFARTRSGATVKSFSATATAPTAEDVGTAQLVGGAAIVPLDPTFAATIETGITYHVFLTPNGDTNGLYVPQKTAAGFIVREAKGGRSTVTFDYRIVATALGQSGQRIAVIDASKLPRPIRPFGVRAGALPRVPAALK